MIWALPPNDPCYRRGYHVWTTWWASRTFIVTESENVRIRWRRAAVRKIAPTADRDRRASRWSEAGAELKHQSGEISRFTSSRTRKVTPSLVPDAAWLGRRCTAMPLWSKLAISIPSYAARLRLDVFCDRSLRYSWNVLGNEYCIVNNINRSLATD